MKELKISRRVGLIDLFKANGFKLGVEIGTDHGGYAKDIVSRYPDVFLFTIDPFLAYTEGSDVKTQQDVEQIHNEAVDLLRPYQNCVLMRERSLDAVKHFKPESIDFVFIDGDHKYESVMADIRAWSKIVKKGGIVAGHDYVEDKDKEYGVVEAVNDYAKLNNIDLYILKKGTYVPCWMFYK